MAEPRPAWWPGGRTAQKTFWTLSFMTASIPAITPPAARSATSQLPGPMEQSTVAKTFFPASTLARNRARWSAPWTVSRNSRSGSVRLEEDEAPFRAPRGRSP